MKLHPLHLRLRRRRTTLHRRTTRQAKFAQLKRYVTSLPRSNLPLDCLQTAIVDPESDTDVLNSESVSRSARFRAFLKLLAEHSDVVVKPKVIFPTTSSIHLQSEDVQASDDSLALTTTDALLKMFEAWWLEFKTKDVVGGASQSKLRSLFRGAGVRASLKPYESADGILSFDPHEAPSSAYHWLPTPPKKLDIEERDYLYFERQVRTTIRALNFVEVVLQTWKAKDYEDTLLTHFRLSVTRAVKCAMQAQVATLCGLIQLRRDHYLASAKGLQTQELQTLRHSPLLGLTRLFPDATLRDIDSAVTKGLTTKALVQSTSRKDGAAGDAKKKNPRSKQASFDNFQQNWSVSRDSLSVFSTSPDPPSSCSLDSYAARISSPPSSQLSVSLPTSPAHSPRSPGLLAPERSSDDADFQFERDLIASQSHIPVGGKLRHFWREWQTINASNKVVRWCLKGYRLPFAPDGERRATCLLTDVCPPTLITSYPPLSEKGLALSEMLDSLLQKQVIDEVLPTQFCFFNIVFLRPKPNGTWRLILDVSRLNEFLVVHKFSMDTTQVIRRSVPENSWASSVDFSDAFHHLPIHRNFHHFLAF